MRRWNVLCALVIVACACDCEDTHEAPDSGFVIGEGDMAPDGAGGADQGVDQGMDQGIDQGTDQGIDQGTDQGMDQGTDLGVDMMVSGESRCYEYGECQLGEERAIDVLWVIDNSGGMCEEQAALLARFDQFLEGIGPRTDMQIGVTTTHIPLSPYPLEPVARAGQLQSTPQPVPGFDPSCSGERSDGFAPLRRQLAQAVRCMQTPDEALNQWTDDEIACARELTRPMCGRVTDRDGDGSLTDADLFPRQDEYRPLPKVLKAEDYRFNVQLDIERLRADFACMALVGTRGTGYEKGLQAAIQAVSPALTAPGAPNAGFLRPGAETAVVFLSDENDCSHDGSIPESGAACGTETCDYFNSAALEAQSPLLKPAEFKRELVAALSASKGRAVGEEEVLVATLVGGWAPYEGATFPICGPNKPAVPLACEAPELGGIRSGDRYQRAARQFAWYYPDEASRGDRLNFNKRDAGALCEGELAPALADVGQRVGQCKREVACP